MKVKFELYIECRYTEFELDTNKLDRNYDDEPYAYWVVEDDFGYIHEINIDKDERGNFLLTGTDYVWFDKGDFENGCTADVEEAIEFEKEEVKDFYSIFIMANKRGVLGWTLMRFDGSIYWHPSNKWYSSYNVARKMRDRLNDQLKSKSA